MSFIIPNLNPEQQEAATAGKSPLLIVAGAGTGKTRTLISRIVHLINSGVAPERICAITFTNKAAAEMQERVRAMIGGGGRPGESRAGHQSTPYIGTFHSLGARILRQECRSLGREPNFTIFDDKDSFDLVKKAVKAAFPAKRSGAGSDDDEGGTAAARARKKKEAPAKFAKLISELKNLPPESVFEKSREGRGGEKREEVMHVFHNYEAALQRNNAFDFDDLIEKPVALFRARPEILRKHQNRFDAILVDEYQDINPKQYEFVRLLAEGHRNLTVVGDDEQTIYTWRYADIKIFLDFDKDWEGALVKFLEENYRSTGNIIRAAAAMVQNNKFRTPKQLWTRTEEGGAITLYEAWGDNEEAAWIAGKLEEMSKEGRGTRKTAAILYRTNAQSRAIEQALIRENIPYKIFGGLKFYERREVKDAVAALRYAANSLDELSRERLEKLSKRKFAEFRAGLGATTNGEGGGASAGAVSPKPTDIVKIFLKTFDYWAYLEENFINSDERAENINELMAFASGFENLPELLERLSLLQATDDENAAAKSEGALFSGAGITPLAAPVHLSTIHMAKGLEFDAVFIAGAAEGLLPHARSIDNDAALEEERRLMYVAMTRARRQLFISFYGLPSRFVGEIPEEFTAFAEAAGDEGDEHRRGRSNFDPYARDDDFAEENVVDF